MVKFIMKIDDQVNFYIDTQQGIIYN